MYRAERLESRQEMESQALSLSRPWLLLVVPGVLAIVVQMFETPLHRGCHAATIPVVQLCVGALCIVPAVSRQKWTPRIRGLLNACTWIPAAIAGGWLAIEYGVDPECGRRILVWFTLLVCSVPFVAYSLAQLCWRGRLGRQLANSRVRLEDAKLRAWRTEQEIRTALTDVIVDTLKPATIDAIVRLGRTPRPAELAHIADQLRDAIGVADSVLGDARRLDNAQHGCADCCRSAEGAAMAQDWISLGGATAALALVASAVLPSVIRADEAAVAAQAYVATGLFVCFVLMASSRSQVSRSVGRNWPIALWSTLVSALLVLAISWRGQAPLSDLFDAYPLSALSFSGSLIVVAASIKLGNQRKANAVNAVEAERMRWLRFADDRERRVGKEISDRLHGPVQGRLSACVMALNFAQSQTGHADSAGSPAISDLVAGHLAAVVDELDALMA
jgi:hypothetical protein